MIYYKNNLTNKIVAGFNTGHHGGCAIIGKGKVVSISEERLNRQKYSDGYTQSLLYCLKALKINLSDVDLFVSSSYHDRLPKDFVGDLESLGVSKDKCIQVDHHLSHAYSTYFLSPFTKALVLVIDGLGNDTDTESYYIAQNNQINKIGGNDPERSMYKGIGRAYEVFTNYCGWSAQEAGKTMGLASYGQNKYPKVDLYKINDNLQIESLIEEKYFRGAESFVIKNKLNFGKPLSGFNNKDAAFFIQDRTEKIILELINRLYDKYKISNLCLAGGVFLNSIINKKILDHTPIKNIFVPPCCDDTGQPLGNALYGLHEHFGVKKIISMKNAFLGRDYSKDEILDVLNKKQKIYALPYHVKEKAIKYTKEINVAKKIAHLLSQGKIVGLFNGASEIGPRALGHRSIICAPYPAEMKDFLNSRIKHREFFRPFAPSVLLEYVAKYFYLNKPSPYMLLVAKAKKKTERKISAVLHIDNTSRIQTVNTKDGLYYKIIKEFFKLTGIPVILDTSFNDNGEPIVETPRDALSMFCKNDLDYLVIEDYLISKS